jgi:hypothetical protein
MKDRALELVTQLQLFLADAEEQHRKRPDLMPAPILVSFRTGVALCGPHFAGAIAALERHSADPLRRALAEAEHAGNDAEVDRLLGEIEARSKGRLAEGAR